MTQQKLPHFRSEDSSVGFVRSWTKIHMNKSALFRIRIELLVFWWIETNWKTPCHRETPKVSTFRSNERHVWPIFLFLHRATDLAKFNLQKPSSGNDTQNDIRRTINERAKIDRRQLWPNSMDCFVNSTKKILYFAFAFVIDRNRISTFEMGWM